VKRILIAVVIAVVAVAAVYEFLLRSKTVTPHLIAPEATSMIGSGSSAVGVGPDGVILAWLPLSSDSSLPQLPSSIPPKRARLQGTMLQQAVVLGAAPAALRPHVQGSRYGASGVDVELKDGIELRFGDASRAAAKWRAAATVLADPSVTALDYVDLHVPGRPAVGGAGHILPTVP
jgi:hypothetical protein